jgi:hypothetical protein
VTAAIAESRRFSFREVCTTQGGGQAMTMGRPAAAAAAPFVVPARGGGVATLTLNRSESFNPLSSGMIAALDALTDDPDVRVAESV